MNITQSLAAAAAILIVAGAPYSAQAADNSAEPLVFAAPVDNWSFEITPYAWLPGLKADIAVRGRSVTVDQSFSDIFKAVRFAAAALGIARYQNWLVWTQVDYFSLSTDKLKNAPARGSVDVHDTLYTVAAGYRFKGWTAGQAFDVLIGAQGLYSDTTLTLFQLGSVQHSNSVVVPVFILRPSFRLSERWLFNPTLSVGGSNSKTTYQLQPQFQFQFTRTWEARIGYRKLHYKVTSDRNNTLDGNLAGPFIGFGATF
jgi:hypothetical protein